MFTQSFAQSPQEIPEFFLDAWNRRDAVALANIFVEDAEFINVVGLWWHNRPAIWKAHDYGLRVIFKDSDLVLRRSKVRLLSDTIALVHARFRLVGQTAHAGVNSPGDRQNLFSFVAQKEAQGWVCVSAHNTDIVPGMETHIVDETGKIQAVDYRKNNQ